MYQVVYGIPGAFDWAGSFIKVRSIVLIKDGNSKHVAHS